MKDVSRRKFLRGMSLAPVAAAAGAVVGTGAALGAVEALAWRGSMKVGKVHTSGYMRVDGFQPYKPKPDRVPEHLTELYESCLPYYKKLYDRRMTV